MSVRSWGFWRLRCCDVGKNVVLSCCHGNTFNIRNRFARQILIPEESSGVGRAEDKAGFALLEKGVESCAQGQNSTFLVPTYGSKCYREFRFRLLLVLLDCSCYVCESGMQDCMSRGGTKKLLRQRSKILPLLLWSPKANLYSIRKISEVAVIHSFRSPYYTTSPATIQPALFTS